MVPPTTCLSSSTSALNTSQHRRRCQRNRRRVCATRQRRRLRTSKKDDCVKEVRLCGLCEGRSKPFHLESHGPLCSVALHTIVLHPIVLKVAFAGVSDSLGDSHP